MGYDLSQKRIRAHFLLGVVLIGFLLFFFGLMLVDVLQAVQLGASKLGAGLFLLVMTILFFGAFVHLFARQGYLARIKGLEQLKEVNTLHVPATILIPSYMEEEKVVMRTLLSAALQRYERKNIRLLIDDNPVPKNEVNRQLLLSAKTQPAKIRLFLQPLCDQLQCVEDVNAAHMLCAEFFEKVARNWHVEDHEDQHFVDLVLNNAASFHRERLHSPAEITVEMLRSWYDVNIDSFTRKSYENLSHLPNKAMNLNTYIDLIGRRFSEKQRDGKLFLTADHEGEIVFDDAKYVLTLDADSILHPSYMGKLVAFMEREDNQDVAVVQTPYAATPNAKSILEKVAGATTDVQRVLHQGFTLFQATFWVGANAVLRKDALTDIREEFEERGYKFARYIQDRTVIEDTESTIDLIAKGWRLWNHPERLAYSATPPDFGALLIQRRRWACGGLLVLPKAIGNVLRRRTKAGIAGLAIQLHYLGSLAWGPLAVLALFFAPFDDRLLSVYLPMASLPYFICYVMDLRLEGRSFREIFAVYGLNLLLIPVNLAGAFASIKQALTNKQVEFQRTPKVGARTAAPRWILLLLWGLPLFLIMDASNSIVARELGLAAFSLVNGLALLASLVAFVGVRATLEDLGLIKARNLMQP